MSVTPEPPSLSDLLERLQTLEPGATADEAIERLRTRESPSLETARERAALVRVIDADVFAILTHDLPGLALADLLAAYAADFESLPPSSWQMRASRREALLKKWTARESEWRNWNTSLFAFLSQRQGQGTEIEAVYHGSAATNPNEAIAFFQQVYAAADERMDFAHCHALLEAVRAQEDFRGTTFSQVYRDRARYLQSRLLFLDALQKSGSYLRRDAPHDAFDAVRKRIPPAAWVFHLHATGGLGKSMFVRWSIARDLVCRRIPCAYIDFDDYALLTLVQYPLRLIGMVMRQWAQQMTHTVFLSAVELLEGAESREGWDPQVLSQLQTTLQGARVDTELIAILDTLEEATLFQAPWLKQCIATLAELKRHLPGLTVVLSGRYDLTRIHGLFDGPEVVAFEMPPFTRREAEAYLTMRRVGEASLQSAIIERAAIGDAPMLAADVDPDIGLPLAPTSTTVPSSASDARLNPFKLALMVELVQGADGLNADDVRRLPNVDIAYLIERVILRIPSQPLRWVIRYGAVARRLTKPFVAEVLLPPLRDALRGGTADFTASHVSPQVQRYLDSKVTWTPEPELADSLDAGVLWTQLEGYARERGWITLAPTEQVLLLHPEVVTPVNTLLSPEPVYRTLHESARDFYLARWVERARRTRLESTTAAGEAIYHATTLDLAQGRALWLRLLREAGDLTAAVAAVPTTSAYLDAGGHPRYPDWFADAHVERARVALHAGGPAADADRGAFVAHVSLARAVSKTRVPPLFHALATVIEEPGSAPDKAVAIERAIDSLTAPYDRLWLHVDAARYWTSAGRASAAEGHWFKAAEVADAAAVPQLRRSDIEMLLGDAYAADDQYSLAMAAYERARQQASRLDAVEHAASLAVRSRDLARLRPLLDTLEEKPSLVGEKIDLRRRVLEGDPRKVFEKLEPMRDRAYPPADAADLHLIDGLAYRWLLNYSQALESFSRATDVFGGANRQTSFAPSRVAELELYAFDMEDRSTASHVLERLIGSLDPFSIEHANSRIVEAFLAAYDEKIERANELLRELVGHRRPVIRSRAALVAAAFGLLEGVEEALERFLMSLRQLDPPERVADVLAIARHLPKLHHPTMSSSLLEDVIRLTQERGGQPFELPLLHLDLARVLGVPGSVKAKLIERAVSAMPREGKAGAAWYGLHLLDHCREADARPPFPYSSLLSHAADMDIDGSPLEAVIKSRALVETFNAGDIDVARRLADEAIKVFDEQPVSAFRLQVNYARTELLVLIRRATAEAVTSTAERPAARAMRQPDEVETALFRLDISHHAEKFLDAEFKDADVDPVSTAMLQNWQSVQSALISLVADERDGGDVTAMQVVTSVRHASLPWELTASSFGSRIFCRGITNAEPARPVDGDASSGRSVLVIKAAGSDQGDDLSLAVSETAVSGFSMMRLYAMEMHLRDVHVLETPAPEELQKALEEFRPAVVHVIGQVFAGPSGVYIDFEGAERRVYAKSRSQEFGRSIDSRRLIRYLRRRAPLVILDITAPENVSDVIRMLLLRNRFAAELFQSGSVAAVLAGGLTLDVERQASAHRLVTGLRDNVSLDELWRRLRVERRPDTLEEWLSHSSVALFADTPTRQVFDGEPRGQS